MNDVRVRNEIRGDKDNLNILLLAKSDLKKTFEWVKVCQMNVKSIKICNMKRREHYSQSQYSVCKNQIRNQI